MPKAETTDWLGPFLMMECVLGQGMCSIAHTLSFVYENIPATTARDPSERTPGSSSSNIAVSRKYAGLSVWVCGNCSQPGQEVYLRKPRERLTIPDADDSSLVIHSSLARRGIPMHPAVNALQHSVFTPRSVIQAGTICLLGLGMKHVHGFRAPRVGSRL